MKPRIEAISLIAAAALVGCANQAPLPLAASIERISFRPQPPPFCGRCETIDVVVSADGQLVIERGHWAGKYRDWRRQREVRHIAPQQFAAFKGILEPYKPNQTTSQAEACANYITDNDGVIVEWVGGDGSRTRVFDFGCLDDRGMNEAVRSAPKALGIPE